MWVFLAVQPCPFHHNLSQKLAQINSFPRPVHKSDTDAQVLFAVFLSLGFLRDNVYLKPITQSDQVSDGEMHWGQRTPWWKNRTVTPAEPQPAPFQLPEQHREHCFCCFALGKTEAFGMKWKSSRPDTCGSLTSPLPLAHENLRLFSPLSQEVSDRKPRGGWSKT